LRVKGRLEENEGRIGSFYGLLYVEKKRTGGKKKYLKATHKSERRSQAIEHWVYSYPHSYGSVSISSLEHLDGYFGIPVRRVRMIRGASRTFIMVTPLRKYRQKSPSQKSRIASHQNLYEGNSFDFYHI
jgi:hypothetical protein